MKTLLEKKKMLLTSVSFSTKFSGAFSPKVLKFKINLKGLILKTFMNFKQTTAYNGFGCQRKVLLFRFNINFYKTILSLKDHDKEYEENQVTSIFSMSPQHDLHFCPCFTQVNIPFIHQPFSPFTKTRINPFPNKPWFLHVCSISL